MRGRKTLYTICLILLGVGLFFIFQGYKKHLHKVEGEAKVAAILTAMAASKTEMRAAYDKRIATLESWRTEEKARLKTLPPQLDLGANVMEAKGMDFNTTEEAARYDYLQTQVLEKVGDYMRHHQTDARLQEMKLIEQGINEYRKKYHEEARQVVSTQNEYRLPIQQPVILPSEKVQEINLFE